MPADIPVPSPVALVVVNFGSHELLAENLGWARQPVAAWEAPQVVVVDNHRNDSDTAAVRALSASARWTLIEVSTNVGFGAAVNRGASQAWRMGHQAICIVNPDLAISREQTVALGRAVLENPAALVAPTVVGPDGRAWGRLGRIDLAAGRLWTDGGRPEDGWLSGACLGVHRDLWTRLGGFDPDYFMYWEDVDLSVRCLRAGGELLLRDDVVVTHQIGGTQSNGGGKSRQYYYYACRNRLLFAAKNLDRPTQRRWAATTPAELRRVVSRGLPPSRVWQLRHAVPPATAGSLAGLRRLASAGGAT